MILASSFHEMQATWLEIMWQPCSLFYLTWWIFRWHVTYYLLVGKVKKPGFQSNQRSSAAPLFPFLLLITKDTFQAVISAHKNKNWLLVSHFISGRETLNDEYPLDHRRKRCRNLQLCFSHHFGKCPECFLNTIPSSRRKIWKEDVARARCEAYTKAILERAARPIRSWWYPGYQRQLAQCYLPWRRWHRVKDPKVSASCTSWKCPELRCFLQLFHLSPSQVTAVQRPPSRKIHEARGRCQVDGTSKTKTKIFFRPHYILFDAPSHACTKGIHTRRPTRLVFRASKTRFGLMHLRTYTNELQETWNDRWWSGWWTVWKRRDWWDSAAKTTLRGESGWRRSRTRLLFNVDWQWFLFWFFLVVAVVSHDQALCWCCCIYLLGFAFICGCQIVSFASMYQYRYPPIARKVLSEIEITVFQIQKPSYQASLLWVAWLR